MKKYKERKKENKYKDFDLTNVNENFVAIRETPGGMIVDLHQSQKEGLFWAEKQECSDCKGGIFAEKGAKLQIVALALATTEAAMQNSNKQL